MNARSPFTYLALCLLTIVLAIGCSNPSKLVKTSQQGDVTPSSSTKTETVKLGFSAWPGWFPWQISEEKALFAEKNVSVELQWFDGYLESINTLNAEKLDGNCQTLGDTLSSVAGGADQVVVLVNDNSTGNDKVIVRDGINSVADLKGKKIAAEEGTVDHFLLLLGLEKAGLSPQDIELVPLETGKAAAAFVGGQVDAVAVFAPFTTQALKRPSSKELFSSKDFPGAISDHLVVTRKFADEHPKEVQALVDTWFATLDFLNTNKAEAYEIMAKRAGVSIAEYEQYADGTRLFTLEDNLQAFQPGNTMNSLLFAADRMGQFLVNMGFAKEQVNTTFLFDDRFVKNYAQRQLSPSPLS